MNKAEKIRAERRAELDRRKERRTLRTKGPAQAEGKMSFKRFRKYADMLIATGATPSGLPKGYNNRSFLRAAGIPSQLVQIQVRAYPTTAYMNVRIPKG